MKKTAIIGIIAACLLSLPLYAQKVTILHTNDFHSQIYPEASSGNGGIARLKAAIDSVRAATDNVLLVNAGDAVQGSLFFTLFKGEVEQKLMNDMGYDILIVGNHEFDNGIESLARQYSTAHQDIVSTNYDFDNTALKGKTKPYVVRQFGDKKIGFMALNINPVGIIDEACYRGLRWLETVEAAQAMAWYLKNIEKVDKVIALTHIGYDDIAGTDDVEVAAKSRYIDAVIGGHSHTLVNPDSNMALVKNLDGKDVLVLQAKSNGFYLGELVIDFDKDSLDAKLIPVNSRLDNRLDPAFLATIEPYRHKVDSICSIVIGKTAQEMPRTSMALLNWLTDFVKDQGEKIYGKGVDLAIFAKGGIRSSFPKGNISKGDIMTALPFVNKIEVLSIKGSDLLDNFAIMASQGGQGVSRNVDIVYNPDDNTIVSATIDGKALDPDKTYTLATIDYLANGGDYFAPLTRASKIAQSEEIIFDEIIYELEKGRLKGKLIKSDNTVRMHTK